MSQKKPDEIMAEYLLKGGKMLAKSCTICGSPLFEWKGETKCVVCEINRASESKQEAIQPEQRNIAATSSQLEIPHSLDSSSLKKEVFGTIELLCKRINEEPDPQRCLVLMECVLKGVEALNQLC